MGHNDSELQKPRWQSIVLSVGSLTLTTLFAAAMTLILWRAFLYHRVGIALSVVGSSLIFFLLAVAFYLVWMWFFFEHPDEIRRALPVSSEELRRRREKYFERLPK
jgi:hypothetical protein